MVLFCFLCSRAFLCPCGAEEAEPPRFFLGDIVITATRTERLFRDIPASAGIIDKNDMGRQKVYTLDEALRYQAGLSSLMVQDETGISSHVGLRGFRGQGRTQLLLNGHPINGGYNGQVDWTMLPVEGIDRIEIVRGPYSALYGGTAMGGTIQIITRDIEKTTLSAKGLVGEDNTKGYRLHFGAKPW